MYAEVENATRVVKFQNNHRVWNEVHKASSAFSVLEEYTTFFLIEIPHDEWPKMKARLGADIYYED